MSGMNMQGQKLIKVNGSNTYLTQVLPKSANTVTVQSNRSSVGGIPQNSIIVTPQRGSSSNTYVLSTSSATSPRDHFVTPKGGSGAGGVAGSSSSAKRRKVHKENKGLRHFSMKVCEKVKAKQTTTYNEVADELVADEMRRAEESADSACGFDQKNIRRRVYDALNVLMAMNIISKEKKEIHWLGLPTNTPAQCANMDREIDEKKKSVAAKEKELKDLILLQVSLKNLVNRNKEAEMQGYIPTPNSHIQLPFIVVNTHRDTHINCSISHDKTEYFFKFDDKFEIHDHVKVLQRMGLLLGLDTGTSSEEEIARLKQLVPPQFRELIESYGRGIDLIDYGNEENADNEMGMVTKENYSEIEEEDDEELYTEEF